MIDPIALQLGPVSIHWYGLVYALGFIIILLTLKKFHNLINLTKDEIDSMVIITAIAGLLMARIFHIVFYDPIYYFSNLSEIIRVDKGGMSIHGGLLGGVIALWFYTKKHQISFFKITDIVVLPLSIILAFGRIANFINQELVGTPTNSIFGVVFPNVDDQTRWPSQLIESIKTMIVFQILLYTYIFKQLKPGLLTAWFLILYNGLRFIVNFVREAEQSLGLISMGQAWSLVGFIIGIILYIYLKKN